MGQFIMSLFASILLLCLTVFNCTIPQEPSIPGLIGINNIPIITGIYPTTLIYPDGTEEVYGNPSYVQGNSGLQWIRVVPNPYLINNSWEPSTPDPSGRPARQIHFTHLPKSLSIVIYKGAYGKQIRQDNQQLISGSAVFRTLLPVRTIEYSSPVDNRTCIWDLNDDSGTQITSGFYRIFFKSKELNSIHWIDVYIIMTKEWVDPTGWLPEDYADIKVYTYSSIN